MSFARSGGLLSKTAKGDPPLAGPDESPTTPAGGVRPARVPATTVMLMRGPIALADLSGLRARIRALLDRTDAEVIVCEVSSLLADAVTVEALARLQLAARRAGRRIVLRNARDELRALLDLTGLREFLPLREDLRLEARGQSEEREEAFGVEEEGDAADPAG
jgi:anti-anti-sigma regulatory factor